VQDEFDPAAGRPPDADLGEGLPARVQHVEERLGDRRLVAIVDRRSGRRVQVAAEIRTEHGRDPKVGLEAESNRGGLDPGKMAGVESRFGGDGSL
jgi:hypothetical protein